MCRAAPIDRSKPLYRRLKLLPENFSLICLLYLINVDTASASADCMQPLRLLIATTETQSPAINLLHSVVTEIGCTVTIVQYDARQSRRLRMLEDGKVDIVPEASDLPERHRYAWVSLPYRIERTGIFVRTEDLAKWPSLDLPALMTNKLRVLLPSGWHGKDFERWRSHLHNDNHFIEFAAASEALRDLQIQRADALIATDYTVEVELQNSKSITRSGNWIYQEPVSFLLSKKRFNNELRDQFNQALSKKAAPVLP